MSVAYVDSSVLTAIAFDEPGATAHARKLDGFARVISSNLLEAELRAAFAREFAAVLETGTLRGADLWHVAMAQPPVLDTVPARLPWAPGQARGDSLSGCRPFDTPLRGYSG